MRKIKRFALAAVLVAATCVGMFVLFPTAASAIPPDCNASFDADGHGVTVKCTDGRGSHYKVRVTACNTGNCSDYTSVWKSYGEQVHFDSGGWFDQTSLKIWWQTTDGDPCIYTKKGGTVTWCDIQANVKNWANRGIRYDCCPGPGDTISNWYQDRDYRPDCSGLVDMAWHLGGQSNGNSSPNTGALLDTDQGWTNKITRSELRAGDILVTTDGVGHAVIFGGWNSSNHDPGTTNGTFSIWTFGSGNFTDDDHITGISFSDGSIAGHPTNSDDDGNGGYHARRYTKIDF